MTSKQRRILASIENAWHFLHARGFKSARIRELTKELGDVRDRIGALTATQMADLSRKSSFEVVESLHTDLRTIHLLPLSRDGKRLLKGLPGIADSLRVPHMRSTADELLDAAERIFDNIEPHAATFRKSGYPRSFLADGRRAAKALRTAAKKYEAEPPPRFSPATIPLKDMLAEGRAIIDAVDSHVAAEFRHDRGNLRIWRTAKRIPRHVGRPKRRRPRDDSGSGGPS